MNSTLGVGTVPFRSVRYRNRFARPLDRGTGAPTGGRQEDLAEHAPSREITANVLMIPLLVTPLTPELLRQALETVRGQDVEQWLEEHLGLPPQKKKRVVLTAAGRRNAKEDPEPA